MKILPPKPNEFFGARIKINRANEHILDLKNIFEYYLKNDSYTLDVKKDKSGLNAIVLETNPLLPPNFPTHIGDTFHNLRTALDHVTSDIVGKKDKRSGFPIDASEEKFRKSPKLTVLSAASPAVYEYILHTLKPFGKRHPLVELSQCDNADKHRLLLPTFSITEVTNIQAVCSNQGQYKDITLSASNGNFVSGIATDANITITSEGVPTGELRFSSDHEFAGMPVLPTLNQLSQIVTNVVLEIQKIHFRT
ncbi:hypothetical protein [Hirschia litorea]|uniref:Uncharacterized protein n=1 Tax=Hirschia litorea TaxID=1199156 RepID=A0ABW2IMA2_9PROT